MYERRYQRIVGAVVESILFDQEDEDSGESRGRVIAFVLGQRGRMPDYLRPPLTALTLVLDLWPHLRGESRPLHRLPNAERLRVLAAWRRSRLGAQRDLIRLYESLAIFGWESEMLERPDG